MTDPLDIPPSDHGSDRYGYIELNFPEGVEPIDPPAELVRHYTPACMDCNANLFLRWDDRNWTPRIAHDEGCPTLKRVEQGISMWTVYDHPLDFPEHIVARRHVVVREYTYAMKDVVASASLEYVRELLSASGLHRLPRMKADDPKIVEVWL